MPSSKNGIKEKAIHDLTESARKQLLFSMARWLDAINEPLCTYALRQAAYINQIVPRDIRGYPSLMSLGIFVSMPT